MVLVAVGDNHAPDALHILFQPRKIRDDNIHPQHIRVGKAHAAVHNEDIVAAFISGDVFADLV